MSQKSPERYRKVYSAVNWPIITEQYFIEEGMKNASLEYHYDVTYGLQLFMRHFLIPLHRQNTNWRAIKNWYEWVVNQWSDVRVKKNHTVPVSLLIWTAHISSDLACHKNYKTRTFDKAYLHAKQEQHNQLRHSILNTWLVKVVSVSSVFLHFTVRDNDKFG